MSKIHIIGTSHISKQSMDEIEEYILEHKPNYVAVELDQRRYLALEEKSKQPKSKKKAKDGRPSISMIKQVGFTGWLFGVIGHYVEQKLGNSVGLSPGSEMLHAIKLTKKHNLQIVFIDQDIEITLRRLSLEMRFKEKMRIIADIFKGIFTGKRQLRKMGITQIDLSTVPDKEIIKKLIGYVKIRYPGIYKVLIKERNNVMARNLLTLSSLNPQAHILAVVGAGHEEGIEDLLEKGRLGKVEYTYSITAGEDKIEF